MHRIVQFSYTIEEQQTHIFSKVSAGRRANFADIFAECHNRIQAIVTFLALLELLNLQQISIIQGLGVNNFWLEERQAAAEEEE